MQHSFPKVFLKFQHKKHNPQSSIDLLDLCYFPADVFYNNYCIFSIKFPSVPSKFLGSYTKFQRNFFENFLIFLKNPFSDISKNLFNFSKRSRSFSFAGRPPVGRQWQFCTSDTTGSFKPSDFVQQLSLLCAQAWYGNFVPPISV